MKKRLRYKMFNACITLKGYEAKEKKECKKKVCKNEKNLRFLYKMHRDMKKDGYNVQYIFTKCD